MLVGLLPLPRLDWDEPAQTTQHASHRIDARPSTQGYERDKLEVAIHGLCSCFALFLARIRFGLNQLDQVGVLAKCDATLGIALKWPLGRSPSSAPAETRPPKTC